MKQSDLKIGMTVYFKKSNRRIANPNEGRIIRDIEKRKYKNWKIKFDNFPNVYAGELTDTPCNQMECKTCKYHGGI